MHHLYPLGKGDPLCPLGFHPQVRWPTRCKRCFRDYKEHGGRKKNEDNNITSSTPSLSTWNSPSSRGSDDDGSSKGSSKGWASSQNLNQETKKEKTDTLSSGFGRSSASWTSTPNLGGISDEVKTVTVSLTLPRRKPTPIDTGQQPENVVMMRRPSASPPPPPAHLTINKNDSLAERVRKMQAQKAHSNSLEKESSQEREKTPVKKDKPRDKSKPEEKKETARESSDVKFLMQVKNARTKPTKPPIKGGPSRDETDKNEHSDLDDDTSSTTGTTTTEGTLVDPYTREYKEQIESLKNELDSMKKRCEKAEKEKSDILLRRLANLDTSTGKFTGRSSEVLKLQKKVNELTALNEDLRDDKKSLSQKVKEIEAELEATPSAELAARQVEQMRSKLLAAETLCEELMDENEDMKKELRGMEEEIEEMQDNFREDQADEYSSLRRELEQTTKNCRVLSFKLKKTERRAEQLEQEKADQEKKLIEIVGGQSGMDRVAKIKELEQELGRSNEVALRLQKELQEANAKLALQPPANQKRAPMLGSISKAASTDGKPSRSSLTRGGSQEDPQQLLRDLQDSLEREADLREQLKNAEEEAINLRKKASRVEDDNESLLLQLKKMATKARTRKLSPTAPVNRLPIEPNIEKDEGISDEEDPAELRILLELNEQEAAVLRRKVEELEQESDSLKRQLKELTEKLALGNVKASTVITKKGVTKNNALTEEKNKVLEGEIADLRKKIIEKERDCERLHAELSLTQKRPKGSLTKSKSLDGNGNDQFSLDLKRQLQVIEQEASVLRTKTQSLEVDNERLQAENKKLQLLSGAKTLRSEKSVEHAEKMTQLETDLKEALSKVKELETFKADNEKSGKRVTFGGEQTKKDIDKIKLKQEEVDRLKLTLSKVETERDKISVSLKELKEDALKSFKPRTAKKPTDFTTKLQLKKMVEDLENEIGELYIVMKNADITKLEVKQNEMSALQKSLEELRSKLSKTESDMINDKNRLQTEITQMNEKYSTAETEKKALSEKVKVSETERDKAMENWRVVSEEKKKQDVEMNRLNVDLQNATTKQTAVADCMKKIEDLKKEGEQKEKQIEKMKKELELAAKLEQNKNKYVKEIGDKTKKIGDLEKKLKESEDKLRQTDKMLTARKDRVTKLEKELWEEKEQTETLSSSQRRMSSEWISEKESMHLKLHEVECKLETVEEEWKDKLCESEGKVLTLESHIAAKVIHIQQLEAALRDVSNQKYDDAISPVELAQLQEKLDNSQRELALKERELTAAKQEISLKHVECSKLQDDSAGSKQTILKLQHDLKEFENKLKGQTKDASHWESKASELEIDLMAERKKTERMKQSHEKDVKNKEIELATLKGKLRTLEQTSGAGSKKINELKDEYEEKTKKLEHELVIERQEYDELTGKYELLEEEHVVTKAKLTVEKETAQGQLVQLQKDHSNTTSQLKSLQDTYNSKTDAWIKEQIELQEKLSAAEERLCGGGWEVEKARLTAKLDEKQKEVERMKQEREVKLHQQDNLKKEHEDLRKKLEDYDRVSKAQRNLALENNNLTRETKLLREKLDHVEKGKKMDISDCKARYETQQQKMQEELHSLQGQVSRFKRERDTFKTMLDTAQKNMTELKASGDNTSIRSKRMSVTSIEELEESKSKLAALEQQTNCLEDELCESRLLSSKLKTELISEKSTAEIKLSEMQSKLNELEEDRLLSSGRTGIPGMRTRMELAWQKERDEQQRLLQETSTLARDLRQTLFELERERDKERLDTKRRLDQLKQSTEEDADDNKKKVSELQCDLLELRDAHAKLRTTNEKLRRERERHERDKDNQRLATATLKRQQQDDDKRIGFLLEQIEELIRQSPDLSTHLARADISYLTPTPPRRNRSKSRSREATPESGISENSVQSTLSRIQKAAEELKATRLAQKKQQIMRNIGRAASSEPREDGVIVSTITPRLNGKAPPLSKRSLSLEQTNKDHPGIWKNDDDSVSSMQSLDAELDTRLFTMQRDTSLDSRLSGGSTQSDVQPGDKKKKKGFLGKLKQLTKSRSIDDTGPDMSDFKHIGSMSQGSDSDMSTNGSKRDLRGKLSDMFSRKTGQHSRSASKERKGAPNTPLPERADSSQRPLSRNGSSSQIPQLSSRSDSSTTSRSMSVTPGMQRKKK